MNRSFAVLSLALLLLTGCSGADKSQDAAGSASPASSASISASAGNSGSAGSSGGQADASSSPGSSSTSAEAKPAPTFGPNHQELELTAEEQKAYQAGEYVPATEKHPALNVPVPVMPEKAKEHSFEGAKAFIQYWVDTTNYTSRTGDGSYERAILHSGWESQNKLIDTLEGAVREGKWFVGSEVSVHVEDYGFLVEAEDLSDCVAIMQRTDVTTYSVDGTPPEPEPGFNKSGQPLTFTLRWTERGWKMNDITGIRGVKYDEAQ